MNGNVVKFPSDVQGENKENKDWLCGYAAGLADAARDGADVEGIIRGSGLTLDEFVEAGTDKYDLDEIRRFFDAEILS